MGVAHLALELGLGDEGRDGVDDDDVDGAAADEDLGDLQGLLAVVGLGDEEVVDVDPDAAPRRTGTRACSASMKAAWPPRFWASAMTWRARVVLPVASGP